MNFTVPGWLVWFGSGIANEIVKDEDIKVGLRLARKVKKLRFMIAEEHNPITQSEINSFVRQLKQNNGFEDLVYVREENTNVNILVRDKKEKIRDIVILVSEDDEFIYFNMKSKIKYKDIAEVVNHFLKKELGIEKRSKTKKEKRKKKRVRKKDRKKKKPQA